MNPKKDTYKDFLQLQHEYNYLQEKYEQEITKHQKTEQTLKLCSARSLAFLEALPDLMFRFDYNGVFLDYQVNEDNFLYVHPDEIIGKNLNMVLPPNVANLVMLHIQNLLKDGKIQMFEYSLYLPIGLYYFEARMVLSSSKEIVAIIRDITSRVNSELHIAHLIKIEKFLNHISYLFISNSYLEIDQIINTALQEIGLLSKVDRTYVFLYEDNNSYFSNTHEWCNDGIEPQIENLQKVPVELFPWWTKKLINLEIIQYNDIDDFPLEAQAEKEILQAQGIVSILVIPMQLEGNLKGFIGFDAVEDKKTWDQYDTTALKTLSDLICMEISRKEYTKELVNSKLKIIDSEAKLKKLTDLTIEGILIHKNGIVLDMNKSLTNMFGFSANDLIGKNISNLIIPCGKHTSLLEIAKKDKTIINEIKLYRKDGSTFMAEIETNNNIGKDNNGVIAIRDITLRKEKEKEIKKLSLAVEQSGNIVMITDSNGIIEYVNPKFTEVTGYTFEEVLGENPRILKSGHRTKEDYTKMWETICAGKTWSGEICNKKKNGELYWEFGTISPIQNEHGEIINFLGTKEIITEFKEYELKLEAQNKELKKAKERAEESDKLKSAFLANMSHEIRTPMNGILGFSSLLSNPNISKSERQTFLEMLKKSSSRMLNIIDEIMDISKIEAGLVQVHYNEINIHEQLSQIYLEFYAEAKEKGLDYSYENERPVNDVVITDGVKLYSILSNLIKNAIKYTDKGSVKFGCSICKNMLNFYVKDTGIGIPTNRQEAIFERFIQADIADIQARQGAGLGLSISKAFVEILGGKIWLESTVGKGSIFHVMLPFSYKNTQ